VRLRNFGGAGVRGLADVPRTRTRRVDDETVRQSALLYEVAEHPLGEGGAADISKADEEDGCGLGHARNLMAPYAPGKKHSSFAFP